jgi:hypothetical protein
VRHIVLILGLLFFGAALQGGHQLGSTSATQDWSETDLEAIAPELVLRAVSQPEPAPEHGFDYALTANSAIQVVPFCQRCGLGRDIRPDDRNVRHGNLARAPPLNG